jgi:serine/threonine protein kinase
MYQLLLGHGPFAAYEGEAPASVILRILRDPAPRPPLASAPVALADLMENALAKDPDKRPQSAGAFAESLRAIEALAGWPQTPYVVWASATPPSLPNLGTDAPGEPAPPAEDAVAATREHLVASRLSQLLQ